MVKTLNNTVTSYFNALGYLSVLSALLLSACSNVSDRNSAAIDCPLRDMPYSVTTPLIDIMLKPEAKAVVSRHLGPVLDNAPKAFMSTEAPSFSAILDLSKLFGMGGKAMPASTLQTIDRELAALEITEADRIARCRRYDNDVPDIVIPGGHPRVLVFEKMTGFRDGPSVEASSAALKTMAENNGWAMVVTDRGGAITPAVLQQFDVVIWNNVSGDVLTLSQRENFKRYINSGGGYVGIHGSGGDPVYLWDWYVDELLGARFIGHPMEPQFQDARVVVENNSEGIGRGLPASWVANEEWYSLKSSPRESGATVIATLDESSYTPLGRGGQKLAMGDHPIAWSRCIGDGRSFYSAIGHRPEMYREMNNLHLIKQGILWAAGEGGTVCSNGQPAIP